VRANQEDHGHEIQTCQEILRASQAQGAAERKGDARCQTSGTPIDQGDSLAEAKARSQEARREAQL